MPGRRRHGGKIGLECAAHKPLGPRSPIPYLAETEGIEPAFEGPGPVALDDPIAWLIRKGFPGKGAKTPMQEGQPHDGDTCSHVGASPPLDFLNADAGMLELKGDLAADHLPHEHIGAPVAFEAWNRPFKLAAVAASFQRLLESHLCFEVRQGLAVLPRAARRRWMGKVVGPDPAFPEDERRSAARTHLGMALLGLARIDANPVTKRSEH